MLRVWSRVIQSSFTTKNMSKTTTDPSKESPETPPFKILITHPEVPEEALDILRCEDNELIKCQSLPLNTSEILLKVKGVHGIFWGYTHPLTKEILDAAGPQLKSISTMSAGIDYVDVEELKKRQIPLGHTSRVFDSAVADLAIGLMLAAARRFHEARINIYNSTWKNVHYEWMCGQDICNAKVGFFGFGGIGQSIAKRLKGFDIAGILYTTRTRISKKLEDTFCAKKVEFPELLAESDIIFIAAPLTPETAGVFNASSFFIMKKHAVLINIARGKIINQDDLYAALKEHEIFAAGIDVMYPEPLPANDKLLKLPNLVITPHIAWCTKRAKTEMAVMAAYNVIRGLAGEPMISPAY